MKAPERTPRWRVKHQARRPGDPRQDSPRRALDALAALRIEAAGPLL